MFSHWKELPTVRRSSRSLSSSLELSEPPPPPLRHMLNMELDLQSLFGFQCTVQLYPTIWLRPRNSHPPPAFGLIYEGAIGQPR
jgi:hypothetical protein